MSALTRRDFIRFIGAGGSLAALGLHAAALAGKGHTTPVSARVVVVGGGFGGATCAGYLRRFGPDLEVTLVERDSRFVTCPFSNTVLGGMNDIDVITHDYARLKSDRGVRVVHDTVTDIDPEAGKVMLAGGQSLAYDRLVVSPGIDLRWGAIEGYDEAASQIMPHAWKAGEQTLLLRRQLEALDDGGVVVIAPPDNPFRCPPGPYERASMIAHYLMQHKPKSKLLILDAKDKFSKQALFQQGWAARYPGMIEWVMGSEGGRIEAVDTGTMTIHPEIGEAVRGDVVNIIPPQQAGAIARRAGLANDDGWCPVDQRSFESKLQPGVHVIGDACIAGKMPKSGYAANSQGKVCAAAIVSALRGKTMPEPSYVNTCYSLVAPDYGISVAAVYRLGEDGIVKVEGSGGTSPMDADAGFRQREAFYARGWYDSITSDIFG